MYYLLNPRHQLLEEFYVEFSSWILLIFPTSALSFVAIGEEITLLYMKERVPVLLQGLHIRLDASLAVLRGPVSSIIFLPGWV
jgi:hypothetical protein